MYAHRQGNFCWNDVTHCEIPVRLLIYTIITRCDIVLFSLSLLYGCFKSKGMEKDLAKMPQITQLPRCNEGEHQLHNSKQYRRAKVREKTDLAACVSQKWPRCHEDPELTQRNRPLALLSWATAQSPKQIAPNSPSPVTTFWQTTPCQLPAALPARLMHPIPKRATTFRHKTKAHGSNIWKSKKDSSETDARVWGQQRHQA